MTDIFEHPQAYPYEAGTLLVGGHQQNGKTYPIGIKTERHAITFAGSGSGKGAAVLIPNAKLWPHNLLVIDPKGEVAKATAKDRAAKGQNVCVVDPWEQSGVNKKFLASFNPLDALDPESLDIKEDIDIISDGIVKRDNPESSHWDDGAQAIISGLIGFVLLRADRERKNLLEVRDIIRDPDAFAKSIEEMKNMPECGGVCQTGASAAYAKEGGYFVSNAEKNTRWLDSQRMKKCLVETTFSMADLKRGKMSLYLVLPAKQLKNHGRFLRLFIRCAISEMMNPMPDGSEKGEECLFLLDEFFAIGFVQEILVSVGLMRSMGLKLWPVLQDLGQLEKLYGREGVQTFFSNTDVQQFFGIMDALTLDHISKTTGNFTDEEMPDQPIYQRKYSNQDTHHNQEMRKLDADLYFDRLSRWNTDTSRLLGKPRLSPDAVANIIKKSGVGVAEKSITFIYGLRRLVLDLIPHWELENPALEWGQPIPSPAPPAPRTTSQSASVHTETRDYGLWVVLAIILSALGIGYILDGTSGAVGGLMVSAVVIGFLGALMR